MQTPSLANDIMVIRLVTLSPRMDVFEGIGLLLKHNISGSPVIDDEKNFLGVFSEKCCMSVLTLTAQLVDERGPTQGKRTLAKDFMVAKLVTLTPHMDVFEAIGLLLKHRISGAPVIDEQGNFLGVFSEKFSMSVLIASAYDELPTTEVAAFMNTDFGRVIDENTDLLSAAKMFLDMPYRRLPVLRDGKLLGQVSRRDVLRAQHDLSAAVRDRKTALLDESAHIDCSDGTSEVAHGRLSTADVSTFMDTNARTISPETDLLAIAQIFLNTPYRRLPVLHDGKLVGQISRRDLLRATHDLMAIAPVRETSLLYLSSLIERRDAPIE